MGVNLDKPERWKQDIAASIDLYNQWFLRFAPKTYREARATAVGQVRRAIDITDYLRDVSPETLYHNPEMLQVLRMCTAPPLARDRLVGLANVRKHLIETMEKAKAIPRSYARNRDVVLTELAAIAGVIETMLDEGIFVWLRENRPPINEEMYRAATVVADRLTGAVSDPIVRNAQEQLQLELISRFLEERGYQQLDLSARGDWRSMPLGTYALRLNVPVTTSTGGNVKIPVDVVVRSKDPHHTPLLIEAKSAGDFTNTNKRRKEEAQKMNQLKNTYGADIRYILFLRGYFDASYLGYEAAEGIDWVWEHRIEDLEAFDI